MILVNSKGKSNKILRLCNNYLNFKKLRKQIIISTAIMISKIARYKAKTDIQYK